MRRNTPCPHCRAAVVLFANVDDQSISFQLMRQKLQQFIAIVQKDPAVDTVVGFTGGGQTNGGFVFLSLKPMGERKVTSDQVIGRLRGQLAQVPGATLFLQSPQEIKVGGRQANASLQADTVEELYGWAPRILTEMQRLPQITDANSNQQNNGLETDITIDRATAARLGITVSQIDNTLYDAFGQRQVSTIYNARNQYHVIMEVAPQYWQSPLFTNRAIHCAALCTASGIKVTAILPEGTGGSYRPTGGNLSGPRLATRHTRGTCPSRFRPRHSAARPSHRQNTPLIWSCGPVRVENQRRMQMPTMPAAPEQLALPSCSAG